MAFTAEVKAKLGLDTTEFQRGLTKATAQVGAAGQDINRKLSRAFGAGDVFKGLLQGIGIGSVQQITDLIVRPFEMATQRAKEMESFTGSMAEITRKEISAINGINAEMRMLEKHASDINIEMGIQQRLIDDLRGNPLTFINDASMQMLLEAERALRQMQIDQAKMHSDAKVGAVMRRRQTDAVMAEGKLQGEIAAIERRRGSEREKEIVRIRKINADLKKAYQTGRPTAEIAGLWNQQGASANRLAQLNANARREMADLTVSSGAAAAGKSKGPRTELERIADRGADFKAKAERAAMLGNRGDAARFAAAAVQDFAAVGRKKQFGSSLVAKSDADVLHSEILSASESLKKAARELEPNTLSRKR